MRIQHALTILRVTNSIIHQVPVHPVRTGIPRMATITTLPALITMIRIVKIFLALVLRRFRTTRIHVGSRYLQCIYIDDIQNIGEISRDYQLISRKYKISRTVSL